MVAIATKISNWISVKSLCHGCPTRALDEKWMDRRRMLDDRRMIDGLPSYKPPGALDLGELKSKLNKLYYFRP